MMDTVFARQAVYNSKREVFAYDLIFDDIRYKDKNEYEVLENKRIKFVCNFGSSGLSNFTNQKKAICNFTYMSLFEGIPDLLGKDNIVVEVSSKIHYSSELIENIKELKKGGFQIVYNVNEDPYFFEGLCELIDIYKIDFNKISNDDISKIIKLTKENTSKAILYGANINTEEELKVAEENRFEFFSGECFSRPTILDDDEMYIKNSNRFNIIVELLNNEIDIERLEYIIKTDLAISYRLLRFINSPNFGFVQKINSISQAIMLLGKEELRKWLTLIVVSEMTVSKKYNEELVNNTIIRGRFCELVAEKVCPAKMSTAFMVGLFSDLDILINKDMESILDKLHLDVEIKDALTGTGNILKSILELIRAYEKMDVRTVEEYAKNLKIDEMILFKLYSQSIDWVNETKVYFNKK